MILPVSNIHNKQSFSAEASGENNKKYTNDTLLPNNFSTRFRIGMDKFTNAITLYPAKGLKGNRNANFYEFLTMGQVPYLIGSGMLMSIFNSANKHFADATSKQKASPLGKHMALGVLFYGLAKSMSKPLITTPIHLLTGVDTEVPYAKVNYELPDDINDTDITSIECGVASSMCRTALNTTKFLKVWNFRDGICFICQQKAESHVMHTMTKSAKNSGLALI